MYASVIVMAISSFIGIYYYLRFFMYIYLEKTDRINPSFTDFKLPIHIKSILVLLLVAIVILGVYSFYIINHLKTISNTIL